MTLKSLRPPRCRWCKARTEKPGKLLHDHCIEPWLADHKKKLYAKQSREMKARAKVERALFKKRREAIKPVSQWEDECRKIVQKIARIRDRHLGCISCDKPWNWDGQWHGSHYRAHGGCSSLQFHLWNINKACWICNKIFSGRRDGYQVGIVKRYGQERLDWLDAQPKSMKVSREYLERFKKVMGKRLRRLEKRA